MLAYSRSQLINDKDEALKAIWFDAPWFYEIAHECGDPDADSVYSRLSQSAYAGLSLYSGDGEGCDTLKCLWNLVFPQNEIVDKARPGCLKITRIIQHCKWNISNKIAQNVAAKEDKVASDSHYSFRGSVISKQGRRKWPRIFVSRTGIYGKWHLANLDRSL